MSHTNHPLIQHLADRLAGFRSDHLELIVAATCAGRAILLIGRHGLGKTVLVKALCAVFRHSTRIYCAAKDDLVTGVAGIPSPTALAQGRLEWAAHERTLWGTDGEDVETCFVDELSRAPRGEAGVWLEIIDQRTLFGKPLPLKAIFAAANPDHASYETNPLDAALCDRFDVVFLVPEPAGSALDVLTRVALVNLGGVYKTPSVGNDVPDGRPFLEEFRNAREHLLEDTELATAVGQWAAVLVHEAQRRRRDSAQGNTETEELYISFRALARLPNVVLDLLAFLMTAHGLETMLLRMVESAELCSEISLASKCSIPPEDLCRAQTAARDVLKKLAESRLRKFDRLRGLSTGSLKSRIMVLEWLNLGEPFPSEKQRLTMLVGQLVRDVVAHLENGQDKKTVLASRLYHNLGSYPEHQHEIALSMLRHRLAGMQSAAVDDAAQSSVSVGAAGTPCSPEDPEMWAPWNFDKRGRRS